MTDEHNDDILLGHTVAERFRCDELLGVGGMGRVYKATQISVNRPVALKVLRPEIGAQREAQERFMREAQTVAGISHPGVVQLVDFGKDRDRNLLYLAMEFVEGVPLSSVMQLGRMRQAVALGIARQIAAALAQAHRAGVVHRDLKPDNVMLVATADGALQVKVLDFGIALPSTDETRLTRTGAIVGTPHYMSPEQAQDLKLTPASDLYSLGVILYEMLAGRLPFVANTPLALLFKHVQAPPPPLGDVLPNVGPELASFVAALLAKTPEERPGSASEVAARLSALETASGPVSLELEVGATTAETFLPLVEVKRATSEATDVFGATVDSSPVGLVETTETADEQTPAPPAPEADDVADEPLHPSSRIDAPPATNTTTRGPGNAPLLALLGLVVAGIAALAWVTVNYLMPSGEDPGEATEAVTVRDTTPSPTPSLERVEARMRASKGVEFALLRAKRGSDETAAIPTPIAPPEDGDRDSQPAELEEPAAPAKDLVTEIGPRADEVEIPDETKKKKSTNAKPPRIPPPTDADTLQRRIRAAGGMCTGSQKCQIDATEPPGHAVCKDDSTCVARCPNGGCIQFCQDRATCWFSCEGGKCNRMVGPEATMTEFTD